MATRSGIDEKILLLRHLGLTEDFRGRLTREEFHQISEDWLSDGLPSRSDQLPREYIRKMCRRHNGARSYRLESSASRQGRRNRPSDQVRKGPPMHPLDIEVLVFLWCCNIARQDLAVRMWDCRHAIPFTLNFNGATQLFMWPLLPLRMKWTSTMSGLEETMEETLIKYPFKSVCAIKVGDSLGISKSETLNKLAAPEKEVPIFFHKEMVSSIEKKSSYVNGMIEVAWSFPEDTYGHSTTEPMILFNLRGNSRNYNNERQLLAEISDIAIIMCKSNELMAAKDVVEQFIMSQASVVMVVTYEESKEDIDRVIDSFLSLDGIVNLSDSMLEVVTVGSKDRMNDTIEDLRSIIHEMQTNKPSSLQDKVKSLKVHVELDQREKVIQVGQLRASEIVEVIRSEDPEMRKERFVPLQGELLKRIAETEREIHELKHLNDAPISTYRDLLQFDIQECRKKQWTEARCRLPATTKAFLFNLETLDKESSQIFLRYLKLELEDLTRETLLPLQRDFKEKLAKKNNPNMKKKKQGIGVKKLDADLCDLETKMETVSLGIEHILRELSQIFEGCESTASKEGATEITIEPLTKVFVGQDDVETKEQEQDKHVLCSRKILHTQLPDLGFKIFEEGYPLEILNGDTMTVAVKWIEEVFGVFNRELQTKGKPLKVTSVAALGIENSGKSSFLNASLGTQFNVSATRCSRGVALMHIKVADDFRHKLGCDYIFVIDTEGLKSSDRMATCTKFDNIMTTFAIGMSDKTTLNLRGNNSSYLTEALPVSVQAFLTMRIAGIHPHCLVVHQGVDSCHRSTLQTETHKLEQALDKLTKIAAEQLKSEYCDSAFQQVIHFNPSEDSEYIASLYDGKLPMAPVSTGYSKDVDHFCRKLLAKIKGMRNSRSLNEFLNTTITLWKEIQMEDFVFRFKTCLESVATEKMDALMSDVKRIYDEELTEGIRVFLLKVKLCLTKEHCEVLQGITMNCLEEKMKQCHPRALKTVNDFFNAQSETFDDILKGKRQEANLALEGIQKSTVEIAKKRIGEELREREDHLIINEIFQTVLGQTVKKLVEIKGRNKEMEYTDMQQIQEMWMKAECEIREIRTKQTESICIENDAHVLLRETFEKHVARIEKALADPQKVASLDLENLEIRKEHQVHHKFTSFFTRKAYAFNAWMKIKSEVLKYIEGLKHRKCAYRKDMMRKTLSIVKDMVMGEKDLTVDFEVDLAIAVSEFAKKSFSDMQREFERNNDPEDSIGQMRRRFDVRVRSFINEATITSQYVESISSVIKDGLTTMSFSFLRELLNQDCKRLETETSLNKKKTFMIGMMMEIVQIKDNWGVIQQLAIDPLPLYRHMLEQRIKTLIQGRVSIEDAIARVVEDIRGRCCRLARCIEEVQLELDDIKSSKQWIELFTQKSEGELKVNTSLWDSLPDQNLNIVLVTKTLMPRLSKGMAADIAEIMRGQTQEVLNSILLERTNELLPEILGCQEQCPFCDERCMFNAGHISKHKMMMHKIPFHGNIWKTNPQNGQLENMEEKVVKPQTCQDRVAGYETLLSHDRLFPYYRYQERCPNLVIEKDCSPEASIFWKWVVKKYPKQVSKHFFGGRRVEHIPKTWSHLTRKCVIIQLRQLLNPCW